MPRVAANSPLHTQAARRRLAPQAQPYWRGIRSGLRLGWWRREGHAAAVWLVRVARPGGKTVQRVLGAADDGVLIADGRQVLSYDQAVDRASALARDLDGPPAPARGARDAGTVLGALRDYQDAKHRAGQGAQSQDVASVIRRHLPQALGATPLRTLTAGALTGWLRGLAAVRGEAPLSQGRVDKLRTLMRAALRHAGSVQPAVLAGLGSAASAAARGPREEEAHNNVVLSRDQRQALLAAIAASAGEDGWLFVAVLDVTGLRPGQLARCTVADLDMPQADSAILHAPRSAKGKPGVRKAGLCSCPLPAGLAARLVARAAALGQGKRDLLLTRPRMVQTGVAVWQEAGRAEWTKMVWGRMFRAASDALAEAGTPLAPDATLYSLRHTRIGVWIEAGLSVTEIAQRVDTSVAMIERHYARDLARRDAAQDRLRRLQAAEGDIYG